MKKFTDFKSEYKPIWCPGCGHFSILNSLLKAMANLNLQQENTVVVSGIGCSSRVPAYTSTYGFHSVHGRALTVATGLKVSRSNLDVFVLSGDGDALSIGGNHFIHSARKNLNVTVILMDNEVYGMTKGQASPTSSAEWEGSKLTPQGSHMRPINPISLALGAGASFVARGFSGNPKQIQYLIEEGYKHNGFSFIQVLSPCVTFVPEQKLWKNVVQSFDFEPANNIVDAYNILKQSDNFSCGIFIKEQREFIPNEYIGTKAIEETKTKKILKEIENDFVV